MATKKGKASKAKSGSGSKKAASKAGSAAEWLASVSDDQAAEAPNMPVKTAELEAERLMTGLKPYRAKLAALKTFHPTVLVDVPVLIEQLRGSETAWERALVQRNAKSLVALRKEAEAWRHDTLETARFLLRKDPEMVIELARIAAGDGLADLVADLGDLVEVVSDHPAAFADLDEPIDTARAKKLASVLGGGKDDPATADALADRNKAFWALDAGVTEIRAGLRFLLRKQPKKLTPLLSRYEAVRRAKNRKSAKAKKAKNGEATAATASASGK
jgi:hypothetical protein